MASEPTSKAGSQIRVGLIGVGNWAKHGHLRVLDLLPDYKVTAVYSQRSEASREVAREYGIKKRGAVGKRAGQSS
ncbi:Gfo/Idh/MocA family oxidoreductase [uncultured Paraburkholderia sp.]|uniref:Gfo/Idh/MocA family oxidoreductase n=1 Tax=uncultured Paraburkholderia sp. TaxID=1822466 RepID=UPI0033900647